MFKNIPQVKIGIVAVSRNCFPEELSIRRRKALVESYTEKYDANEIFECPICIVESELHMTRALKSLEKEGCNALCVYLGNFGPEIAETMLAQKFDGPVMFCAASEESGNDLLDGRGDAYCGLLNASYSLQLRKIRAYIPPKPVGSADECAKMIHEFVPIARALVGIKNLKIISFGPRPNNFIACNAPIQGLYDIRVEIEENSELDLFEAYQKHLGDPRIDDIVADMERELGDANCMPEVLGKLAQYELTLLDWIRTHKGSSKYIAIASKCWPAFQTQFGFVPCYVNSRLTSRGIPVACEVDIYGALSEYIGICVSGDVVTLLDINNTVPDDIYVESIENKMFNDDIYNQGETFMGFHCGNTSISKLIEPRMCNQRIMARTLPEGITQGTIEGDITSGLSTIVRLQSSADTSLKGYIAQGEILPVSTKSFGSIAIFGIKNMDRFYRYVLVEKGYPHHAAITFGHHGKYLYEVFKYLGVELENIDTNIVDKILYKGENPFE